MCRQVSQTAVSSLTELDANSWTVFNSSSWELPGVVLIPFAQTSGNGEWRDEEGRVLSAQHTDDEWVVQLAAVPACGQQTIAFFPAKRDEKDADLPFAYAGNRLQTPYYDMQWNDAGQLVRLYDKEFQREVLKDNCAGNVLQVFEDKPKSRHEAWDIDIYYQEKMSIISDIRLIHVLEIGPVRAVILFEWKYGNSLISQKMTVYGKSRRIDFATTVDWREQRQLLKAAFPVNIRATEATYDIQFGNVKRPTHWNTSWDWARFETVGHQWADLSERNYGVSLLNDCKYGYDIKADVMRLTLIKSAKVPDDQADQGEHFFIYSLLPHTGDWYAGKTVQEAWNLNQPFSAWQGKGPFSGKSLFRLSGDHVAIDAVKKAEDQDGIILRVHEFAGMRTGMRIESDFPIQGWQEVDLLERGVGDKQAGSTIRCDLQPYEIKTFLVFLAAM